MKLLSWNAKWPICVYTKTAKGYGTKQYLQVGIPDVSTTDSRLEVAMRFVRLCASIKVKPSDFGSLLNYAGTPPTTSITSSSSIFLLFACEHSGTLIFSASPSTTISARGFDWNRGLNGTDPASPIVESVSAKWEVTSSRAKYDTFQWTTRWFLHGGCLFLFIEKIHNCFFLEGRIISLPAMMSTCIFKDTSGNDTQVIFIFKLFSFILLTNSQLQFI